MTKTILALVAFASLVVCSNVQAESDFDAKLKCMQEVRRHALIPDEVDFDASSLRCSTADNTPKWICVGRADMMNAFGVKIPHYWACEVTKDGSVTVALK